MLKDLKWPQNIGLKLLLLALMLVSTAGWADLQQVQDAPLENTATDISNTLNSLAPQLNRQTSQLQAVNSSVQRGLTGSSAFGGYNNLPPEQEFRNWTPSSADLANMVQQGLQTGSLADQIAYYNQRFQIPTADALTPSDPDSALANYAIFSAIATNSALGIADKGFDNVASILKQINSLYKQIDQMQTLKQSADLNAVILLKIAALQTDLIRLQAQQLKMQAVSQQEGNSKRTFMTQFIQNPK